jgi:hypothetical protein
MPKSRADRLIENQTPKGDKHAVDVDKGPNDYIKLDCTE